MKTLCYRIDVKGNEFSFSIPLSVDEEQANRIYKEIAKAFPSEKGFSVEVFKIEQVEKLLITENWLI